ncbi:MAG: 5-bromo-4-chloroindolyl phosphate hydrolysis family protein [Pseudomonadota bacterium]
MSAQRFGGQYSPGGASGGDKGAVPPPNKFRGRNASSVDVRALAMFVLPTPLLFAAFGAMGSGSALALAVLLVAYCALMLGAWLLREGQRAHAAYDARTVARPPAFPRKLCAAALAGIGVFLGQLYNSEAGGILAATGALIQAAVFAVVAAAAHVMAFGIDPMKAKGDIANISAAERERVSDAIDKAEDKLKTIEDLAHKLRDREVDDRVTRLNATVREMIRLVEEDPRDLSRARRYLGVYLKGAMDATQKYADNHERLGDPKIRDDYLALLTDLEASFQSGKQKLLLDDKVDLEVEIEVLRDRLGQEGA